VQCGISHFQLVGRGCYYCSSPCMHHHATAGASRGRCNSPEYTCFPELRIARFGVHKRLIAVTSPRLPLSCESLFCDWPCKIQIIRSRLDGKLHRAQLPPLIRIRSLIRTPVHFYRRPPGHRGFLSPAFAPDRAPTCRMLTAQPIREAIPEFLTKQIPHCKFAPG
jgi:hypothetical protein